MSATGQPARSGDSHRAAKSAEAEQSAEAAKSAEPEQSETPPMESARAILAARLVELRGMDTVDTCRIRLLSLRTRIETNWPEGGGPIFRRGQGLSREATADIAALLVALPTPLPLRAGGEPQPIIYQTDTDMRAVAGRAVDAGLTLLEGTTLESIYPGHLKMLESHHPNAIEPITVSNPTVGVLVATIIGTLEAIWETVMDAPRAGKDARAREPGIGGATARRVGAQSDPVPEAVPLPALPQTAPPKRGRRVPRI